MGAGAKDVERVTMACSAMLVAEGGLGARCLSTGAVADRSRRLRIDLPVPRRGDHPTPSGQAQGAFTPSLRRHQLSSRPLAYVFRGTVPCVESIARIHRLGDLAVWVGLGTFLLLVPFVPWVAVGLALLILVSGWFLPNLDPVRIEVDLSRESALLRGVHPGAVDELVSQGAWVTS